MLKRSLNTREHSCSQCDDSRITGSLPAQLVVLPNLEVLDLSHNALDGFLPAQLATTRAFVNLDFSGRFWCPFPRNVPTIRSLTSNVLCEQCPQDDLASPSRNCTGGSGCVTCADKGVCDGGAAVKLRNTFFQFFLKKIQVFCSKSHFAHSPENALEHATTFIIFIISHSRPSFGIQTAFLLNLFLTDSRIRTGCAGARPAAPATRANF